MVDFKRQKSGIHFGSGEEIFENHFILKETGVHPTLEEVEKRNFRKFCDGH